jgi:hypothetical protein
LYFLILTLGVDMSMGITGSFFYSEYSVIDMDYSTFYSKFINACLYRLFIIQRFILKDIYVEHTFMRLNGVNLVARHVSLDSKETSRLSLNIF